MTTASHSSTVFVPSDRIRLGKLSTLFSCTVWDHTEEWRPVMVQQFRSLSWEAAAEIARTLTEINPEYCAAVDSADSSDTGVMFDYRGCYEHGTLVREGRFAAVTLVQS